MEKRVVLLVVLCVLVFVGWSLLMRVIYPPSSAPPAPPPAAKPETPKTPETVRGQDPPPPVPESAQKDVPEAPDKILDNNKVRVTLTNRGAGILDAVVRVPDQADMHLLKPFRWTGPDRKQVVPHLAVKVLDLPDDTAGLNWTVAEQGDDFITYRFKLSNGVDLEKKFVLKPETNKIEVLLQVGKNPDPDGKPVRLRMIALTGLEHDSTYRYDYYGHGFYTTVAGGSRSTTSVAYDAPKPAANDPNGEKWLTYPDPSEAPTNRSIEWFGLRNRYAAVMLLGEEDLTWIRRIHYRATKQLAPEAKSVEEGKGAPEGKPKPKVEDLNSLEVQADFRDAEASKSHAARFSLVLAPIRSEDLKAVPGSESFLLSYGCWGLFNPIGKLILWLLNIAHLITGNYGWAIILTTLVVRLALFPLTKKSQVSMARMGELQPKLNALRERYPDDPAKQQQETMKLFREEKVNPLSGCLPIMMQLPIFIGLYSVLDISLEFRNAPFISWIDDLSQPDRLVEFGTVNLLVTSIREFNLLPIVMTITWFLQSYYAPRPQDPKLAAQQRMMMFMPVVFGLLCYSLASGLSLYLFVNSLLAMIEQKIIKKYFLPGKGLSGPPAPVKT